MQVAECHNPVTFTNRQVGVPVLVAEAQAGRQRPDAGRVIGFIFRVGVDL